MTLTRTWMAGLAACALVALVVVVWPLPSSSGAEKVEAENYRGPEHQTRQVTSRVVSPVFQLTTASAPTPAPVAAAAAPTLVGLVGGREAYLRSAASGQVSRVTRGAAIDGWRVVAVGDRTVTVRLNGEPRVLNLFSPTAPIAPASPVTPGVPSGG